MREAGPGVPAGALPGALHPARRRSLLRRQLPRGAAEGHGRRHRAPDPHGMGPGSRRELARCRLVLPRAQHGRRHRAPDRRIRGRGDRRGLHLRQHVQAGGLAAAPQRGTAPGGRRAGQLPDRLLRPGRAGRALRRALRPRARGLGADSRRHRRADRAHSPHPRQLPHRRHARHGGDHRALPRTPRAPDLGPQPLRRRGPARAQPLGRGVRRRLHLQVPERRPRRAGLRLHGRRAPSRRTSPPSPAGSPMPISSASRTASGRRRPSTSASSAPRRSSRSAPSGTASPASTA